MDELGDLMGWLLGIERALEDGRWNNVFERSPELRERFKAALKAAGLAAIEAEMRGQPERYQEHSDGTWSLTDAGKIVVPFPAPNP